MIRLFDYFLRIVTLPRHFTLSGVIHVLLVLTGVAVLYLLTLRPTEEGKLDDYLQRVWKRIYYLREKALSYHLAFIHVTAGTITSILDQLFGTRLFSIQAMGVSLSLALFCAGLFYLFSHLKTTGFSIDYLGDCLIALSFAFIPFVVTKTYGPTCREGGLWPPYEPVHCRYLSPDTIVRPSILELAIARLGNDWKFACLCSSTMISIWFFAVLVYIYSEYFSFLFCVYCYPPVLRPFLVIIVLGLFVIFAAAALLFTFFSIVTKFTLKQLAIAHSTAKSIGYLLLGCLPIATFIILLEIVLSVLNLTMNTSDARLSWKEGLAIGLLVVFGIAFLINAAFFIAPILFFAMAILLLIHRLLWPMLERPIDKLQRIGITKHPWVIFAVGVGLIAFGIGGIEGVIKVFKFLGYGTS